MKINFDDLLEIMGKLPVDIDESANDVLKFVVMPKEIPIKLACAPPKEVTPYFVTATKNYRKYNWDLEFK